jgi:hypothetical protein
MVPVLSLLFDIVSEIKIIANSMVGSSGKIYISTAVGADYCADAQIEGCHGAVPESFYCRKSIR